MVEIEKANQLVKDRANNQARDRRADRLAAQD